MMEEGGRIFEKGGFFFRSCIDTLPSVWGWGHAGGVGRDGAEGSYIYKYILREGGKEGGREVGKRNEKGKKRRIGWLAGLGDYKPFLLGGWEGGRIWRRCITYDGGIRNLSSYKAWLLYS